MDIKTIGNYGGPYVDASVVENPKTTMSSANGNRLFEDVAQMTATSPKAIVHFSTTLINGAVAGVSGRSQFGIGNAALPSVSRTATGLYTVSYSVTYTDDLGYVETVSFFDAWGNVVSLGTAGIVQATVSASTISVAVFNPTTGALSDLGGGVALSIKAF